MNFGEWDDFILRALSVLGMLAFIVLVIWNPHLWN